MTDWVAVDARTVNRHRSYQERKAINRANYDTRHYRKTNHHKIKPFCMWDGEGPKDAGYALFGNSLGMEICHPYLQAKECLELIIQSEMEHPGYIHVSFGFNYDVSMILGKLPFRHLTALHHYGKTIWKGYQLEHIPHKWFRVKYGKVAVKIFDIRSFFAGNYLSALKEFHIGEGPDLDKISTGKANRAEFYWRDIEEIRDYFRTELKLGPPLCEALRKVFQDAGYNLQSWHGPGALARMALRRHKVYAAMAECPEEVNTAALFAFAAGRFELVQAGHIVGEILSADLHSAYPWFATMLPNLAKGTWRKGKNYEPGKFAVYHIRYESDPDPFRLFPLFKREKDGSVCWPCRVEGWYWAPEAGLVANDPDAVFVESWVFDEEDPADRPFAWLQEYYDRRALLKRTGNAAQYTFKLIINSVYGQLAQRAGWDRKNNRPPRSHQIEWAGYITSACRAAVYGAGTIRPGNLVSVDTDGVYILGDVPIPNIGPDLGQWEIEKYDEGIFWQSGIYMLRRGETWVKAKTRGIPKGSYTSEDLLEALREGRALNITKRVFVTYGLAQSQPDRLNQWIDEPHEFTFGGKGKRMHFPKACGAACRGALHRLGVPHFLFSMGDDIWSVQHYLPWRDADNLIRETKLRMDDLVFFDANHLADDETWVLDHENPHETGLDQEL